jgi:phage repressor protein C with HTH and peptisase S24 domain
MVVINSIEIQRFKKVRDDLHLTQHAFAQELELKGSTADIERGKTKLSGKVVMLLFKKFKINPLWLFGESHEQYVTLNSSDVSPKVITLKPDGEESILLVNQKAAAGYPHNIQDSDWYETLPAFNLPIPQFRNATYRGFQVEGDSMMPNIRPNDWVLGRALSSITELSDGKIYIVVLQDSVLVKKIQKINNSSRIKLISLNEEYLPIEIDMKEIQELWQVNSKLSFGINEPGNSVLLKQLQNSMDELRGQIKQLKD